MAKKKGLSYEEKMLNAIGKLPVPIEDIKHRIKIFFIDDRARSNQTRYEHIIEIRHELNPNDIKRVQRKINSSILKKDEDREDTYNLYIRRTNYSDEYIKISMELNYSKSNEAIVKTMYITKNLK